MLAPSASFGAEIVWTNTAGGNWNVAANWTPNQIPGASDTAIITNSGDYAVTLVGDRTIAGLRLGGESGTQTLAQASSTYDLTLAGPGYVGRGGRYNLNRVNFTGTNAVITVDGELRWSRGTVAGGASLVITTNGTLSLALAEDITLVGTLTNYGTVHWSGAGLLGVKNVLHNQAGALFETTVNQIIDFTSGTPAFINDGVFRKAFATGVTRCQVPFINNGVVDVQTGTFRLDTAPKTFNHGCRFIGAGRTLLYDGIVTMNGTIESENLVVGASGMSLAGHGVLAGTMLWNAGSLAEHSSLTVATNGTLEFALSEDNTVLSGTLTNYGLVQWSGTHLHVRSVIHNGAGGVFDTTANNRALDWYSSTADTPVFINDGTFRKSGGAGTLGWQIGLVNNGTIEVQVGTIEFVGLEKVLNHGCRFVGPGTSLLSKDVSGGLATLTGTIESENLVLGNDSSLGGAGSVRGGFTWNSGTLTPEVSFNVTTNGLLLLASSGEKNLNGSITNAGVVRWTSAGNLVVRGVIHNLPTGLFDAQNNEVLDFKSGTPVIVNEGVFRKSAGTGTTLCQIPFSNLGRVEAKSGRLNFTGAFSDQGGEIALGGGQIQTLPPLTLTAGRLTGWGSVANDVFSSGFVRPAASNGVLRIQGNYTQLLAGTLELELAGTAAGTNHSRLEVSGSAAVAGTLGVRLAEGYLPAPGDAFNVLTFASRAGDFVCHNGFLFLGQNRRLLKQFASASLTLMTVSAPDPTDVVPSVGAQQTSAIVCWPTEFVGYALYSATNVATPEWTPLPGVTNRYLETPMVTEKFFRLGKP